MRWPLRHQILLPMVCLILAALVGVSLLNAYLSARHTRMRIEGELTQVTETLANSNFPLTDRVLQQMKGLSGAEFVLVGKGEQVTAASTRDTAFLCSLKHVRSPDGTVAALATPVEIGEFRFFHKAVALRRIGSPASGTTLHVLYPEERYFQAWRDVVYPPLLVGAAVMILVVGFSFGIASRVTRPLSRLQSQVEEIATGHFRSVAVPQRDDEIADLSRSANRMTEMLVHYESEVRRNEQLRTLGQLGGGIAHQMRNSVTGCRLAVDLHKRECSGERESLQVAMRQLELMEKYLQRFLSLGRNETKPHSQVNLQQVVDNVASLVGPTAQHVDVELQKRFPSEPVETHGDADALEQLLVNLVLNAIESAAHNQPEERDTQDSAAAIAIEAQDGDNPSRSRRKVTITLRREDDHMVMEVEDTGIGPAAHVASRLFEPFVTEKPDGTGLGLSVAREIANAHGGEIRWHRRDQVTSFLVELPMDQLSACTE